MAIFLSRPLLRRNGAMQFSQNTITSKASHEGRKHLITPHLIHATFEAPLALDIKKEYNGLVKTVANIGNKYRTIQKVPGINGSTSVSNIIAYQIGWGKRVIEWYNVGLENKMPIMPGDGFTKWDYAGIGFYFYEAYKYDCANEQDLEFFKTAKRILEIVEKEYQTGNLDKAGIWEWTRLKSGKKWPLSKWIQINTTAPYKKSARLIRSTFKETIN